MENVSHVAPAQRMQYLYSGHGWLARLICACRRTMQCNALQSVQIENHYCKLIMMQTLRCMMAPQHMKTLRQLEAYAWVIMLTYVAIDVDAVDQYNDVT